MHELYHHFRNGGLYSVVQKLNSFALVYLLGDSYNNETFSL